MKNRSDIIERINAELAAIRERQYNSDGSPLYTMDPTVISLDYHVRSGAQNGAVNIYGNFNGILKLKPQVDLRSSLNDNPNLLEEVKKDIRAIERNINAELRND
jgi:hypothetical protein